MIFGRLFVKWFALCYRTIVLSVLSCPVCNVGVLWPNGWMDQDETWHSGRPRPWTHCVRWGPNSPCPKRTEPPIFGPYLLRPNGYMDQDATWYGGRPWPKRLYVTWGPRSPPQKDGGAPKFSAHVYCGQRAGWTKMLLGMEVVLRPGDFVWHGDPALSPKRGRSPLPSFRPISIVAKWLDASRCHLVWR